MSGSFQALAALVSRKATVVSIPVKAGYSDYQSKSGRFGDEKNYFYYRELIPSTSTVHYTD
jgi:hypothetical protein